MSNADPYSARQFRRADPVQDFRDHEGEVNDEIDAARDREAESGRDAPFGAFSGLPWALGFTFALVVAWELIAALWPH